MVSGDLVVRLGLIDKSLFIVRKGAAMKRKSPHALHFIIASL